jgi:WD40 repeat protein
MAHALAVPNWFMGSVAFSPDGKMIAAPGGANALYVWDLKTGEPLLSFQKYRMQIQKVWFTADSRALVSYSMADSVFKIVHLNPKTTGPTQPSWGAQSWPSPPSGVTLGSISGFVRDTANKPIVGVEISIFDGEHPGSPAIAKTETNAAGHFLVQKMRVRHIILRASKPGYLTDEEYAHMSGHEAGLDLVLRPHQRQ